MVLVEVRVKDDPLLSQQVARGEVERSFVSSLDGSAPLLALLGAETARGTGALSRCGGRAATAARRSCRLSPGRTSISDIAAQRARSGAALVPARAQAVIKSEVRPEAAPEVRPEAAPVLHPFGKCNYYTFVKIPCSQRSNPIPPTRRTL